jgi:hypothetical protein
MSPFRRRHRSAALLAAALAAAATPAGLLAQGRAPAAPRGAAPAPLAPTVAPTGSYGFVLRDDDGDVTRGTVAWQGALSRIDLTEGDLSFEFGNGGGRDRRRSRGATGRPATRKWLLIDRRSGMLHVVKDDERLVETMPVGEFETLIARVLGYVAPVVDIAITNAGILARDLGDGGLVAGVPTRRFQVVERYDRTVRALGFHADAGTVTVTTEVRVPTALGVPSNPLATLTMATGSVASMFDGAHRARVAQAQAALWSGAPVQIEQTTEEREDGKTTRELRSMTVTEIGTAAQDPARFTVPAGYQRKKVSIGRSSSSSLDD